MIPEQINILPLRLIKSPYCENLSNNVALFQPYLRLSVALMYMGQVWEALVASCDEAPPSSAVSSLDHRRDRCEKLAGTLSSSFPLKMPLRESNFDSPPKRIPLKPPSQVIPLTLLLYYLISGSLLRVTTYLPPCLLL